MFTSAKKIPLQKTTTSLPIPFNNPPNSLPIISRMIKKAATKTDKLEVSEFKRGNSLKGELSKSFKAREASNDIGITHTNANTIQNTIQNALQNSGNMPTVNINIQVNNIINNNIIQNKMQSGKEKKIQLPNSDLIEKVPTKLKAAPIGVFK